MPPQGPELRDIHVPQVPWWPLAPGWWVLLVLVVALLMLAAWAWHCRARRRRYIDHVLAELHAARARHDADGDNAAFAASAHQLVRRVARARDAHSVTLTAEAWRAALAAMAPKRNVSRLATLGDVMYRPRAPLDIDAVTAEVDGWVRDVLARADMPARGRSHAPS
jgi:hypothetical protein